MQVRRGVLPAFLKRCCHGLVLTRRRHIHNELDQPTFTQPHVFKVMKQHDTPLTIYAEQLVKEGITSEKEVDDLKSSINSNLQNNFTNGKRWDPSFRSWLSSHWNGMKGEASFSGAQPIGIDIYKLRQVGIRHRSVLDGFKLYTILKKQGEDQRKSIELEENILWATAEALAFGSLRLGGYAARLAAQDSERGTLSQRHSVLRNHDEPGIYVPLNNLQMGEQAHFLVCNSNLSEMAVLGFEMGYSPESPRSLVV